jgi:hypothetical protein
MAKCFVQSCCLSMKYSCRQKKPVRPIRVLIDPAIITIQTAENFCSTGSARSVNQMGIPADEVTGGTRLDGMPIAVLDQHPSQKADFERHTIPAFAVIG